ncbi:MAG TPA: hypothetical protein VLE73_02780 [Candidatus Saccharimonadales bacterium]|nr:hypothetical protein [Candidatus Saccharimonadales bacterium]
MGRKHKAPSSGKAVLVKAFVGCLAVLLVTYVVFMNTVPFDRIFIAKMNDGNGALRFDPPDRFRYGDNGTVTTDQERLYFLTKQSSAYDRADVTFKFKPGNPSDRISIGYDKDQDWTFNSKDVYVPFLEELKGSQIGMSGLTLYGGTTSGGDTVNNILKAARSKDIVTGVLGEAGNTQEYTDSLPGYAPASKGTDITVPLRGDVTFYTYLSKEFFNLKIIKHDLNWYSDPDPLTINVYKGDDIVYSSQIPDDGDVDADRAVGQEQNLNISNPDSGYPEAGVYKVQLKASSDVIIDRISTNLHNVVFGGPLYIANSNLYGESITNVPPLYFQGKYFMAKVQHKKAFQSIKIGEKQLRISELNKPYITHALDQTKPTAVTAGKGDIIVNGSGVFAFSKDQIFRPFKYDIFNLDDTAEGNLVDQIISDYRPARKQDDGWYEASMVFDISDAYYQDGLLRWQIVTGHANATDRSSLQIADMQVVYKKDGWLRK